MNPLSRIWPHVPSRVRHQVALLSQSKFVTSVAHRLTSDRLRILAFHGVPDPAKFAAVIDAILDEYTAVSEDDVVMATCGQSALPAHPVWFTFDDGLPSTLGQAELLAERGVRATAFVCPGVLDTKVRLWFQVWEDAHNLGLLTEAEKVDFSLSKMKDMSDEERRRVTGVLEERLQIAEGEEGFMQGTQSMLDAWVRAGHFVGNHTWDHPLLDRCSPLDQKEQVLKAHDDLVKRGFAPRFLAYPNGNVADGAIEGAREAGYVGSLLFDHRLTNKDQDVYRLSRLRIDSHVPVERALSIVSGAHPALFQLALRPLRALSSTR